jgi:hypothetical protein
MYGQQTPRYDDWDYVFWNGNWYKVGPFHVTVDEGGVWMDGTGIRFPVHPIPPGDESPSLQFPEVEYAHRVNEYFNEV